MKVAPTVWAVGPRRDTLLDEADADEVQIAATPAGPGAVLVWSRATLGAEQILVARSLGDEWSQPRALGIDSFRPAVAAVRGGVFVAATAWQGGRATGLVEALREDGSSCPIVLPGRGEVLRIALAAHGDEAALVAWEERRGPDCEVRAGLLDLSGRLTEHALPARLGARRSPAVAPGWLAWVEGPVGGAGRVRLMSLRDERPLDVDPLDPVPHEAPALAVLPDGRPVVAWHAPAGDVLRWLEVAVLDDASFRRIGPAQEIPGHAEAGPDQGWELPALAVDTTGRLWAAGRSSHGWHVMVGDERGFGPRAALSMPGWGGRGARLGLCSDGAGVLLARREPDGIVISRLEAAPSEAPPPRRGVRRPRVFRSLSPQYPRRVLWGDLHQHTAHSDGAGTVEELLRFARDERGLDFAAITDHDRFCRRAIGPATWRYLCAVTDAYHDPGCFVTFPAYEFTGARHPGPGHKCVYFGDRVPDRIPEKDVAAVFAEVRRLGGLAVPHHVGWTGADLEHHDPAVQPVWEICSVHGCYERLGASSTLPSRGDPDLPGHFVRDALEAGLRFGFIGSTDSHGLLWHHGISPRRDPFATGLAGVIGAERDRGSILAALRARRTIATTGARVELFTELDGAPLGSELPAGTRGTLHVRIVGTAPLARVALVRRGGEQAISGGRSPSATLTLPIEPDAERAWDYLYVRVEQDDGEMAWSSPIWLG